MNTASQTATKPTAPRLSEGEAAALQLDSYFVQIRSHICQNCGCGERFLELFEVHINPSLTARTRLAVKRPTSELKPGFDVAYLELPERQMPVCSECIANYSTPEHPAQLVASPEAWADTLKRKYTPEPTSSSGSRSRPEPTLDQL